MKRYSAWIASGLLLFVVLACNLSKNKNVNVNVNSGTDRPANAEIFTEEVYAAKQRTARPRQLLRLQTERCTSLLISIKRKPALK